MATDTVTLQSGYAVPRRFRRFKLDVPVRVIVHNSGSTKVVTGRGTQLNQGGMCVFAGVELKVGEQVGVEFTPPYSGQPIRVPCLVRDRKGYSYGLEFLILSDEDDHKAQLIRRALEAMGSPEA